MNHEWEKEELIHDIGRTAEDKTTIKTKTRLSG
jgi:hypothetical protein